MVDGFSRSGNSYAVCALRLTQPGLKIRGHLHLPAYPIYALKNGKPVCILLRKPIDAVVSWAIYAAKPLEDGLDAYIGYYSALVAYRSQLAVIPFEELTKSIQSVIKHINSRFDLNLVVPEPDSSFESLVLAEVAKFGWDKNPLTSSRPSADRAQLISKLLQLLNQQDKVRVFSEKIKEADRLYVLFKSEFEAQMKRADTNSTL
jgi:hypothetical protein